MRPRRLSILGVGLLGGSIGLAVRSVLNNECTLVGYGHRAASLDTARDIGAIDEGYVEPAQAVRGADLVILCTPVGVFPELLRQIAPALKRGALVTDVGSTKRSVVAHAERTLPSHVHFVGSHPMAGSDRRGVEFARTDLFQHAICITTPTPRTHARALQQIEDFWKLLGMRIVRLSPEEHDQRLADISHLPHAAAAALVAMQEDQSLPLAGKGFMDATRIAGGDGGLWRDIFLDNRDNLKQSLKRLTARLDELVKLLEEEDAEALRAWLDSAAERRHRLMQEKLRELNPD